MPTGAAIDLVAKDLGVECFETPTGEQSVPKPLNRTLCQMAAYSHRL